MPVETERKFRIDEDAAVPDIGHLGEPREFTLVAAYFDSPALSLARKGITLRRRTGGHDDGWHLKLPLDGDRRQELSAPLGASELVVPRELRTLVADALPDLALVPVAVLTTHRRESDLLEEGTAVAHLTDDRVHARHGHTERSWRELEVELTDPTDLSTLDVITSRLAAAGVEAAPPVAKLVQAFGDEVRRPAPALNQQSSAADVIAAWLRTQVGVIAAREQQVIDDAPDAVHKVRVATRRLRAGLKTFRRWLSQHETDPVRAELRWFAGLLGGPRDAEVLRDHLLEQLEHLPADEVVGPVRDRLTAELTHRHDWAHEGLLAGMGTARFDELNEALAALAAAPPVQPAAVSTPASALEKAIAQQERKLGRAWRDALQTSGAERRHLQHEARKSAKGVRYAWEACQDALPRAAERAEHFKQVTETLGVVQDSVVARGELTRLAGLARAAAEPTATYAALIQREEHRARQADVEAGRLLVPAASPRPSPASS